MEKLIIFAFVSSVPLVIGSALGIVWRPGKQITGVLLALASGALISAAAFELFKEAYELGGALVSAFSLLAGAIVFVLTNTYIDRKVDPQRGGEIEQREKLRKGSSAIGWALVAGVTLDGVPENLALGLSIEQPGSIAILVAVFISNFPESLVGSIAMSNAGSSHKFILGVWGATAALLTLSVIAGGLFAKNLPEPYMAGLLAFAGGAVLASLADTLMPEAFEHGKPFNSFATALGFFISFYLANAKF